MHGSSETSRELQGYSGRLVEEPDQVVHRISNSHDCPVKEVLWKGGDGVFRTAICIRVIDHTDEIYRGADKSLARPGRKQARKHVREARDFNNIETRNVNFFFFDMNMSYRLAFCKTIAHFMSHNNRRQLPRRK